LSFTITAASFTNLEMSPYTYTFQITDNEPGNKQREIEKKDKLKEDKLNNKKEENRK
jgi:hypothetical protein